MSSFTEPGMLSRTRSGSGSEFQSLSINPLEATTADEQTNRRRTLSTQGKTILQHLYNMEAAPIPENQEITQIDVPVITHSKLKENTKKQREKSRKKSQSQVSSNAFYALASDSESLSQYSPRFSPRLSPATGPPQLSLPSNVAYTLDDESFQREEWQSTTRKKKKKKPKESNPPEASGGIKSPRPSQPVYWQPDSDSLYPIDDEYNHIGELAYDHMETVGRRQTGNAKRSHQFKVVQARNFQMDKRNTQRGFN